MKLYAFGIMTHRPNAKGFESHMITGVSKAHSEEAATGLAYIEGRKRYPPEQGWEGVVVQVTQVPDEYITELSEEDDDEEAGQD